MGAVAPTPAPALSAGPVPYPVMLGSDPGVCVYFYFTYFFSKEIGMLNSFLNMNFQHLFRPTLFSCPKQWSGANIVLLMANHIILM